MSPEHELLLGCARCHLEKRAALRIHDLLRQDPNWRRLIRLAKTHGLVPLLYLHLSTNYASDVPLDVLNTLRLAFHQMALRSRRQVDTSLQLLDLFAGRGIPVVPLKGPLLGLHLYGDAALRPSVDVDLLVPRSEFFRARSLLLKEGFAAKIADIPDPDAFLNTRADTSFKTPDRQTYVELHWDLARKVDAFPLDPDAVWTRVAVRRIQGRSVTLLSPEDTLLYLCAHGAKHGWMHLKWLCDVAEFLRKKELDLLQLLQVTHAIKRSCALLLGLRLAHTLLQAPLPEEILQRIEADKNVAALARQVERRLFEPRPSRTRPIQNFLFQFQLKESLRDRLAYGRYLLRLAVTPGKKDRARLDLPSPATFLYYFLRPYNLARRAANHLWRFYQR